MSIRRNPSGWIKESDKCRTGGLCAAEAHRCSRAYRFSGCPNIAQFIFLINTIDPKRKIIVGHSSALALPSRLVILESLFSSLKFTKKSQGRCKQNVSINHLVGWFLYRVCANICESRSLYFSSINEHVEGGSMTGAVSHHFLYWWDRCRSASGPRLFSQVERSG